MKLLFKLALAICFLTLTSSQNRRTSINRKFSTSTTSTTTTTTTTATAPTTPPSPLSSSKPIQSSTSTLSTPTIVSSTQSEQVSCLASQANVCFSKVPTAFTKLIHGDKQNRDTEKVIDKVCSTISDSLTCTQDIIDESCSGKQGKYIFDAWKETFNSTVNFACGFNRPIAEVLVNQSGCWDFEAFLSCVEKNTNLKSIQNLMEVQLDQESCRKLDDAFANCNEEIPNIAENGTKCTDQEYRLTTLATTKLLHHFLSNSYCNRHLDFGVNPESPNIEDDENKNDNLEDEEKDEEKEHSGPQHTNTTHEKSYLPVAKSPNTKERLSPAATYSSAGTEFTFFKSFFTFVLCTIALFLC